MYAASNCLRQRMETLFVDISLYTHSEKVLVHLSLSNSSSCISICRTDDDGGNAFTISGFARDVIKMRKLGGNPWRCRPRKEWKGSESLPAPNPLLDESPFSSKASMTIKTGLA